MICERSPMPPLNKSECDLRPPPPCPAIFNLAQYCLTAGPDEKTALIIAKGPDDPAPFSISYAALRQRVRRAGGGLLKAGVKPGERVLLRIGHSSDFPVFFLAAAGIGAVPVPSSVTLSAKEAAFIARDTDARLIIASPEHRIESADIPVFAPEEISGDEAEFAETGADDLAYIIYTSGSSGRPKGVAHAHRAVWARRMMWEGWYGLGADDVMLHAGAFNWTYTLGAGLMDPWAAGASTLIYAGPRDPGVWPALARRFGATIFAATPGVYRQLLNSDANVSDFGRLRHGLSAGESMAAAVRTAWEGRTGRQVYEALGMTELSTYISSSPSTPPRAGTAGRAQAGRRIAILPIEGGDEPLPIGEAGLIAIDRSDPGLMLGYWRMEAETEAAMRGDWFTGGDVGVMDADGYIRFEGRADDQMNALGSRVAPEEVEAAFLSHPAVTGAGAVELPVKEGVSVIAAFLTVESDAEEEALRAHAAQSLATYKLPKIIRILPELPRNPNGKLRRRDLVAAHGFKS